MLNIVKYSSKLIIAISKLIPEKLLTIKFRKLEKLFNITYNIITNKIQKIKKDA